MARGFRVIERPTRDQPFYAVQGPRGRDDIRVVSPDLFDTKKRMPRFDRDNPIDLEAAAAVEKSEGLKLRKEVKEMRESKPLRRGRQKPLAKRDPYTLLPGLEEARVRRPTLLRGMA